LLRSFVTLIFAVAAALRMMTTGLSPCMAIVFLGGIVS
jgi:hypothetical protein